MFLFLIVQTEVESKIKQGVFKLLTEYNLQKDFDNTILNGI